MPNRLADSAGRRHFGETEAISRRAWRMTLIDAERASMALMMATNRSGQTKPVPHTPTVMATFIGRFAMWIVDGTSLATWIIPGCRTRCAAAQWLRRESP